MAHWSANDSWGYKHGVSMSAELQRILKLRRRALELDGTDRAETLMDMETERYRRPVVQGVRCRCSELDPDRHAEDGCITRLRLPQAQAVRETRICGGLFAPIGVGWGKTLIDLLLPFAFRDHDPNLHTFVLLVPPSLSEQLEGDYRYYGQHFRMPQIIFHGRVAYANTVQKMDPYVVLERDAPVLHVVPYSNLSRPESTSWLSNELKPDAIIADEAHRLRNAVPKSGKQASATGGRVWRYMEEVAPHTKFAPLSGSMTAKRVADYWHLLKWALRGGSPVPTDLEVVEDWSRAINPSLNPAPPGALEHLLARDAEGNITETLHSGFKRRIAETVGVVTTATPAVDVPLELDERVAPPLPESVIYNLKMVRGELPDQSGPQRPDGDELLTALEVHAVAMQVAAGFYYKWIYPRCEFPRDNELVDEWREARREFAREIRQELKNPKEHLDSPKLLTLAAERAHGLRPKHKGLPEWKSKTILRWYKVKSLVYAEPKAVWFDDYLVNDAIQWALNEARGVVWYDHATVGERMSKLSGLPYFGGGKAAKVAMLGDKLRGIPGVDGSHSIICSIKAHGTGTNGLQYRFADMLFLNPSASPDGWEQPLGRLHRPGQNNVVRARFYRHTPELKKHVDDALRAAYYVEGTGFGSQKIIGALAEK